MDKNKKAEKPTYIPYLIAIFVSLLFLVSLVVATRYMNKSHEEARRVKRTENENQSVTETPSNSLPEEFPNDFPIYENSTLSDSWTTQSKNINGMSFVWKTEDPPKAVFDFFKEGLSGKNYDYKVVSEETSSYTISFEKEDVAGFVGITKAEGQTTISVTMGIKQPTESTVEE